MFDASVSERQSPLGVAAVLILICVIAASCYVCGVGGISGSDRRAMADAEKAEALLFNGVFADDPTSIHRAEKKFGISVPTEINSLALVTAVTLSHKTALLQLISDGAPINGRTINGSTALMLAAGSPGSGSIVKALLQAGANPNAVSDTGDTAMSAARRSGDPDMIRQLSSAKHS